MNRDLLEHLSGLPPVRVLYSDFDGTLLGPGGSLFTTADGKPTLRAAAALVDVRVAGITMVPVSGRRHGLLAMDTRLLGLHDYVAEAGTVICREDKVHYVWGEMPPTLAPTPREGLERVDALPALLAAFPQDLRVYEPWDAGRIGEFLLHGRVDVTRANRVLAEAGAPWAHLVDNGAAQGWPGREVRAYHLMPRGTGKARAVVADLADRGLGPEQAAAVGDSMEDATMAPHVGTYIQVANGHAPLGRNGFAVEGAMGEGFADAVAAILHAARRPASQG